MTEIAVFTWRTSVMVILQVASLRDWRLLIVPNGIETEEGIAVQCTNTIECKL